jgi:hypothetical protein
VPALVSWAVPKKWMSEQEGAVASQKLTWPAVTLVEPETTAAVRVTWLPEATDVTTLPLEVTVSVVVVGVDVAKADGVAADKTTRDAADNNFLTETPMRMTPLLLLK